MIAKLQAIYLAGCLSCCHILAGPNFAYSNDQGNKVNEMSYSQAAAKLEMLGETHLLNAWNELSSLQQEQLLKEIEELDPEVLILQRHALKAYLSQKEQETKNWQPFTDYNQAGSKEHLLLGRKLIAEGKVGCLLVAGGQGTRLSYDAPKGTFPVSVVKNKSLFQIFAEKTIAAGKQVNRLLPLAVMTSPLNHETTVEFFHQHDNFGLSEKQLFFFCQDQLPFLDDNGHLMLLNGCSLAKGPDGNGGALNRLIASGIWQTWQSAGIEYLSFILVDNPLADPFDAELIGFHAANQCEITVKCVEKTIPEERVGLLVASDQGVTIVEYSEMSDSERKACVADGSLKHRCTNISLFCFSMDFVKNASNKITLPWHFAHKATCLNGPLGWKFETFIFDYLSAAQSIKALLYPRSQCFAPLKNGSGNDSLSTVQEALQQFDRQTLESICPGCLAQAPLELDQQFHYPTEKMLDHWKNRQGTLQGFITPDYENISQ